MLPRDLLAFVCRLVRFVCPLYGSMDVDRSELENSLRLSLLPAQRYARMSSMEMHRSSSMMMMMQISRRLIGLLLYWELRRVIGKSSRRKGAGEGERGVRP